MIGGVSINPQITRLKSRVDILVATPGRLLDHVQQKTLDLSHVEILVLDEADRMLDMGFIRDIKKILVLLPEQRQNLLFSATFSDEIRALADGLLNQPAMIEVARRNATAANVTHIVHPVDRERKLICLPILSSSTAGRRYWCSPAPSTAPTNWPSIWSRMVFHRSPYTAIKASRRAREHWRNSRLAACRYW